MTKNKLEFKIRMDGEGTIKGETFKAGNNKVTPEECEEFIQFLEEHIHGLRQDWLGCYGKKEAEE